MNLRLVKTNLLHLDEVHAQQGINSHGGTRISHYSEKHLSQCLQCVGWSAHLYASYGRPVQCFWEEYSVKTLYLNQLRSVRNKKNSGMDGGSIDVVPMLDFWMGGVDQGTFGLSTAAQPLTNKTVSSS